MSEHKIYKPKQISGFPEWLPEYRAIELQWMDKIRAVFESYGFCSIETPSVEEIDALTAKGGETEKEIYTLARLHADPKEDKEARLALHFDLTVPMARYVAQHFNDLVFPFKRYQIQKSWRGERPQKGRYREFYQCDIDVVNIDSLPLHFDAELPAVLFEAYQALGIPPVELHISNRKIVVGFLQGLGISDDKIPAVTGILDKRDKIGRNGVEKLLFPILYPDRAEQIETLEQRAKIEEIGLYAEDFYPSPMGKCLDLIEIQSNDSSFAEKIAALGVKNDLMQQGIDELKFVMDNLQHLSKPPLLLGEGVREARGEGAVSDLSRNSPLTPTLSQRERGQQGAVIADLSIIRGLDYYTGTVLEVRFQDKELSSMSIGGGGRYDNLAGSFINQKLPGIGVSIGLTRLFGLLLDKGLITAGAKAPTQILVVLPDELRRAEAAATANTLRKNGHNVELYHSDTKIKKQLSYAEKKGIPYVWFPPFEDGKPHEVKDMRTGEQKEANPDLFRA